MKSHENLILKSGGCDTQTTDLMPMTVIIDNFCLNRLLAIKIELK